MEALRRHLGLGKIMAIGSSYGGMVALTYATRYPQNLSHLIVIATVPDCRFLQRAQETLNDRGTPEQMAIAQFLWDGNFDTEQQLSDYFRIMQPLYSVTSNATQPSQSRTILSIDAINEAFGGFLRSYNVLDQLYKIRYC